MRTARWLEIAFKELGVREVPGPGSNRRILEYHQATTLKATDDDVAWCSAFLCWVMKQAGLPSTESARARSWLEWGVPITFPVPGCVAVLQRGRGDQPPASVIDAPGHVGLFTGFSDRGVSAAPARILLMAGNQSNMVCIDSFGSDLVLGYRVPAEIMGE